MANRRTLLFVIFTISGFSGLIYESIWTHYLKLFLGHAAYAQTLVLAIFMGGLTIGSWTCSRYSARWKNLLRGYALAEGIVGILALVFHPVFDHVVRYSYATLLPALGSPAAVDAVKWTISGLLILPQSVLLGMTFPLMSAALLRRYPETPGRFVATLYFTNSIGAAVGVLVSGFVLIRVAGLPGTIRLAGCINVALAVVVWLISSDEPSAARAEPVAGSGSDPRAETSRAWYRLLLLASLLTGAASFVYEVGWIRMLSLVLGSSTHAFELMLSAFIFGLAFGGLWLQRRIDGLSDPVRTLVVVQIAMGLLAVATLPVYEQSFGVMRSLVSTLPKTDAGYALFNLSSNFIALAIMLPATFCAGMTLPLITTTLIQRGHGERSIGAVYATNTVGAIVGVFAAIHLGMPALGLKGLITAGASVDMGLGLLLLWAIRRRLPNRRLLVGAFGLCACAVAAVVLLVKVDPYKMASGVYRRGALISPESTLVFHEDGKTATVSIVQEREGESIIRDIRTNGKVDAGIGVDSPHNATVDEPTMVLLAAIPMAHHPDARTVANIGLGSGLTSHTFLCNPRLEVVDTIEIEQKMVEAARHFGPQVELTFSDPRSRIHVDDAKSFFASQGKKYDIIVSEPSNPWVSGVGGLFSSEFYRLARRHLNERGLFVQWVQLYEIDLGLLASIFKALEPEFEDFVAYTSNAGDLLIVARNGGVLRPDPFIFTLPRLAGVLDEVHVRSMRDIEVRKIGDKRLLSRFFESFPERANSDYYPVLDQNAARARFLGSNANELVTLTLEPMPLVEMLSQPSAAPAVTLRPTVSLLHPAAKWVNDAITLREYLEGASPSGDVLEGEAKWYADEARKILLDCGPPGDPNRRVFLFNSFMKIARNVTPAESDAIWKEMESTRCAGRLSAIEEGYVSLFKAVGRRDGASMASASQFLLGAERDITPARMNYVLAAGMLGLISEERWRDAESLWNAYEPRIAQGGAKSFVMRLLEAEMLAGRRERGG